MEPRRLFRFVPLPERFCPWESGSVNVGPQRAGSSAPDVAGGEPISPRRPTSAKTALPGILEMNKLKPFLTTAVVALIAVAIALRVPALKKLVVGS